ncbi:zinc finger MYM-type protein 5 isoform X3 [Canis lupus familiaris]|uniref:zinc finger MYM-type protein 5 isoform X3 n=1 Tax=Canis lupus familiaris TaxID=9615 RepID=UPI000BA9FAA5|nr:zinc finger MYM-type protein 5 isoform X3 [Canis lupus familiaris]|eukprot:XP_022265589.1 zinc finger MYM-type protein 5 isoform X3 [Canis lupus familiaris]
MDKCSLRGLDLTEQTPVLLEHKAMAASLTDTGNSFGDPSSLVVNRSRNSLMKEDDDDDDDDVVFIESIQPPSTSTPAIADQRNFIFASSRNERLRGNYSIILPSSRDLASQKGNVSETIVIDDEEDTETNGGEKKNSSNLIEWGLPGTKNRTKDLDFSTSSLSRSKTKTGVGPFNPGRMNMAGDEFQNGGYATHHSPGKQDVPTKKASAVQVGSRESSQEFCSSTSLSPYEDNQNLRKKVNKSRCIICSKLTEIRHEVSVNNVIHKLCSNQCFNKYRLANGLIMNCCEQCGEYLPSKSAGNNVLIVEGQQTRFCCQGCVNEYKQMMETKSKNSSASENRKRNAVREENERKLYGPLNTLLEKKEGLPEQKEKTSELQVLAECTDTLLIKQDVTLPSSVLTIADKFQEQLEEKKSEDSIISVVLSTDPGKWPRILNTKQRDILVENDPPQVRNFNFPKDNTGRKFSETYYTRILPNGDKTTRSWLLYSTSKDSVFCLYCKLFGEGKNQLKNENGCKDWQHLSHILSKHEESEMHINNSVKYSKLKSDLRKNKTMEAAEHGLHENEKNDGVLLLYM